MLEFLQSVATAEDIPCREQTIPRGRKGPRGRFSHALSKWQFSNIHVLSEGMVRSVRLVVKLGFLNLGTLLLVCFLKILFPYFRAGEQGYGWERHK